MTRVGAYVRVSTQEQVEGYSIEAQQHAIRVYCVARGWAEPDWYVDEGASAHRDTVAARPAFARLIEAAERGDYGIVVAHKLDRWARNVVVAVQTLTLLERHRVAFVSIAENIDFTGPFGRAMFAIIAVFAQLHSDNLSSEVKKGNNAKRRRGLHVGGVNWGARREAGQLTLRPERAALLREIYRRAATESDDAIAADLNARGTPAPRGGPWHAGTIRYMRRVGADWLLAQGGDWPALVAAARARPRQAVGGAGPSAHPVRLLSGLLRCPCGGRLSYSTGKRASDGRVRHSVSCSAAGVPCGRAHTNAERVEDAVEAVVLALDPARLEVEEPLDSGAARREVEGRRRRLRDLYEAGEYSAAEWRERRAVLAAEEARLPPAGPRRREIATGLRLAQGAWTGWPPEARNAFLHGILAGVEVGRDRATLRWQPAFAALLGEQARTVDLPPRVDTPRRARGEGHGRARLTADDVRAIRRRARPGRFSALAREYGVSVETVSHIHHRRTWRHLPEDEGGESGIERPVEQ